MAKRNPYSRWRRLPPTFRSGDRQQSAPPDAPERLILYVSTETLKRAEDLAAKSETPTIQRYCSDLLTKAVDAEHVKHHVADMETKRGPLKGLKEISADPDYLSEWRASSHPQEPRSRTDGHPHPQPQSSLEMTVPLVEPPALADIERDVREMVEVAEAGDDPAGQAEQDPPLERSEERPTIRIEPAPLPVDFVIKERMITEVMDGNASKIVIAHLDLDNQDPYAFLSTLRRGQTVGPAKGAELLAALDQVETDHRGAGVLDRSLSYALHRLALESQVLLTEAWPGMFDEPTITLIREVQYKVERILSDAPPSPAEHAAPDAPPQPKPESEPEPENRP